MNVYRIKVSYDTDQDSGHSSRLYVAKSFDVAVKYACSIGSNDFIPADATFAVVESAELIGPVSVVGEPVAEPDYKGLYRNLTDWVNNNL